MPDFCAPGEPTRPNMALLLIVLSPTGMFKYMLQLLVRKLEAADARLSLAPSAL